MEDEKRTNRASTEPEAPCAGTGSQLSNRASAPRPGPEMVHARGMTNGNYRGSGSGRQVKVGLINGLSREAARPSLKPSRAIWKRPTRRRRTAREALARRSLEPLPGT